MTARTLWVAQKRLVPVAALWLALCPLPSWAQNGSGEAGFAAPSEAQLQYNRDAVLALSNRDYGTAVTMLRAALALGELNVLYLNLGRAWAGVGNCVAARGAYASALSAPAIEVPTPAEVATLVERYRGELDAACSASLSVVCEPSTLQVQVDTFDPVACGPEPLPLLPGEHVVIGLAEGKRSELRVVLTPGEQRAQRFTFEADQTVVREAAPGAEPAEQAANGLAVAGWVTGGVGLAALATAFALDMAVLGPTYDDYRAAARQGNADAYASLRGDMDTWVPVNQALFIGGGALTLVGAGLVAWSWLDEPEPAPSQGGRTAPTVALWFDEGRGGVVLRTLF